MQIHRLHESCELYVYLCSEGDFTGAIQMLRRRLGLLRVAPLEPIFQRVYEASWAQLKGHSLVPPLQLPLVGGKPYRAADPPRVVNSALLLMQVREAHKLVTGASALLIWFGSLLLFFC